MPGFEFSIRGAAERLNSKGGVGKTGLEARKRFGAIFGEAFSGLLVLGGNQNGRRGGGGSQIQAERAKRRHDCQGWLAAWSERAELTRRRQDRPEPAGPLPLTWQTETTPER
ncbi:MAG: hypothetical protein K6U80_20300, partial [Firmicutes bacterium]|nr:hypothetical protein [Bacillota bacterium]